VTLNRTARAGVLAFVTAFAVLGSSVLVHRLVSAKLLSNFAFFVISLTMLGFAISGVVLSQRRDALLARLDTLAVWSGVGFTLSMLVAAAVFARAPNVEDWGGTSRSGFLVAFVSCIPLALLFVVPYAFAGLLLGALLCSPDLPVRRIYFLDLLGSAFGAILAIPAIRGLGVERSLVAACALMLATCVISCRPRGALLRGAVALAAAGLLVVLVWPERVIAFRYARGSYLGASQVPDSGYVLEHVAWDPIARIEVLGVPPPAPAGVRWAAAFDDNAPLVSRFRRVLTQNNNAYTYAPYYDGTPSTLTGLDRSTYATAYVASSVARPRAVVLGVGGGLDILTALRYDAREVTGVEINGATLDILARSYADYFRHWTRDPRVRLVHDDGRHFLARAQEPWDVIQLSGVDSASGTPAAAHVFSENDLYTVEAFRLYLSRLSPDGILNVSRQEWQPPRDMLRAVAIAVEALRLSGVESPANHVVVIASRAGDATLLLLKRNPFTAPEVERLARWIEPSPYWYLAAAPGRTPSGQNLYAGYLRLGSPRREAAFLAAYPYDVRPTTDDRPFFFRTSRWRHVLPSANLVPPVMEVGTLALGVIVAMATLLSVYLPLRLLARRGLREPRARRLAGFFVAIGLGYMAIEISLLQRFALLLGHPNYALSVVLAALLSATGVGSATSAWLVGRFKGELRFVSYGVALLVLGFLLLASPRLASLAGLPFAARVAIVFAVVTPLGLLLGVFFPSALDALKTSAPAFVPWAWGLNGIASVLGPVVAVAVSMTWGIDALLLAAVPLYLIAGVLRPDALAAPTA
jgi:spermidine synthase